MANRRWLVLPVLLALVACTPEPRPDRGGRDGGGNGAGATGGDEAPRGGEPKGKPLVILHTNDIHGVWDARHKGSRGDGPLSGGFLALDARVRAIEAEGTPVLLLDAGDLMTGHPISRLAYKGVHGGALMHMMNAARYDAWALGNHEFDVDVPHAIALISLAKFPTLSANLVWPDAPKDLVKPSIIVEKGGIKIGIVGLMTERLPRLVNQKVKGKVDVTPLAEAARREIAALDPKTDLIILLSHQGRDEDKELAKQVPGADIIVGGHSHTPIERPFVIDGVLVVQNEAKLRRLGRLDVEVADDRVVRHNGRLIDLPAQGGKPGPEMEAIAAEIDSLLSAKLKEVIGTAGRRIGRNYYGESHLGNWVTDTLRTATEADIGLFNSGGLRSDIKAGPITVGSVQEVLLENYVCVFEATGEEVKKIAYTNALAAVTQDHGILQVSGLSYRFARLGKDVDVRDVRVGGKPVEPAKKYRIVGSDYIFVGQPEKYLGFKPATVEDTGQIVTDVIIGAIREAGDLAGGPPLGRIQEE